MTNLCIESNLPATRYFTTVCELMNRNSLFWLDQLVLAGQMGVLIYSLKKKNEKKRRKTIAEEKKESSGNLIY